MSHFIPSRPKNATPERVEAALWRAEWYGAQEAAKRRPKKERRPLQEASQGYARMGAALYRDREMTPTALRLVQQIAEWARGRGQCDAYVEQIADMLQVSVRTVQYAQKLAEDRGFIRVERVRNGRTNDANIYHLLGPALPPAKRTKPRPARRTAPRVYGVQNSAPHEERAKAHSPLNPPRGRKMRLPQAVGETCGLMPASTAVADFSAAKIKRLGGGGKSKHRAKTGPP